MPALRFEVGRSFGIVGNVLVLCFVFGKISAILGQISAVLVLGLLASVLRHSAIDLGAAWVVVGRLGIFLVATWAAQNLAFRGRSGLKGAPGGPIELYISPHVDFDPARCPPRTREAQEPGTIDISSISIHGYPCMDIHEVK